MCIRKYGSLGERYVILPNYRLPYFQTSSNLPINLMILYGYPYRTFYYGTRIQSNVTFLVSFSNFLLEVERPSLFKSIANQRAPAHSHVPYKGNFQSRDFQGVCSEFIYVRIWDFFLYKARSRDDCLKNKSSETKTKNPCDSSSIITEYVSYHIINV